MKSCICIMSYGLRYHKLLNRVINLTDKYDIYVFVSSNDEKINDYQKLFNDTKVNIRIVYTKSAAEKRNECVKFMKENADTYSYGFIIEDDVDIICEKITPETKRQTSDSYRSIKTDIEELLDVMISRTIEYHGAICGALCLPYLGFLKPGLTYVNKAIYIGQLTLYDCRFLRDNNINVITDKEITDDLLLGLDILMHGGVSISIRDYRFLMVDSRGKNSIEHSEDEHAREMNRIRSSRLYNIPLRISSDGIIMHKIRYENYHTNELPKLKNKEKYDVLYEMLDNGSSYDELKNYIITEILKK